MKELTLSPIGIIHSPYKEKFSVPRQPELVQVGGVVELLPPFNQPECVRGLEQFSHLWLIFQFDKIPQGKWSPTVRPPRLGGNERIGVFATRSTHRPNPLGLSKVKLERVEINQGKVLLHLESVDLVDGTPIFDIKPYIAFVDSEPNANSGFAQEKPLLQLKVEWTEQAKQQLQKLQILTPHFERIVEQVLAQDPRPAYQQNKPSEKIYGMRLFEFNIRWQIKTDTFNVAEIIAIEKVE